VSSFASSRALRVVAARWRPIRSRLDRNAGAVFILPAVLVILAFSIFPLLASLYVSLSRLSFSQGGVELKFVGLSNYAKLLFGIDRTHFLGVIGPATLMSGAVLVAGYGLLVFLLFRYVVGSSVERSRRSSPVRACGLSSARFSPAAGRGLSS